MVPYRVDEVDVYDAYDCEFYNMHYFFAMVTSRYT